MSFRIFKNKNNFQMKEELGIDKKNISINIKTFSELTLLKTFC
jgi:hypothetical protein